MASIKYRPESVEFYAPDSFERDSLNCCYSTVSESPLVCSFTLDSDGLKGLTGCVESICAKGDTGPIGIAIDRVEEIENRIKKLEDTIAMRDCGEKRESRMDKLRRELRTLRVGEIG